MRIYIATFVVLILAIFGNYFFGNHTTGFAVFSQYPNETSCVAAGYDWENFTNQTCENVTSCVNLTYDCEPCLEYEDLNGTQGNCTSWTQCVSENQTCTTTQNCTTTVIGGQCTGDVCDAGHLNLCTNEDSCDDYDGYWYNNICNQYECSTDEDCGDGLICTAHACEVDEESEAAAAAEEELVEEEEIVLMSETEEETEVNKELSSAEIENLDLIAGYSQLINWSIENTGNIELENCQLKTFSNFSSWLIFDNQTFSIRESREKELEINVSIPEDSEEGNYTFDLVAECSGASTSKQFVIEVIKKKLDVNIIEIDRVSEDKVKISYSLEELAGEDQEVELQFSLFDSDGEEITNFSVNQEIDANKVKKYKTSFAVDETLQGNLTLEVDFNSESYSNSVQEPISLSSKVGGFVIFEGVQAGSIAVAVVALVILVMSFVIIRLVRKTHQLEKKSVKKAKKGKKRN